MQYYKILGIKLYWWIIICIIFVQVLTFSFFGESSYIGIHDNLDIHIVDYQIMKLNNAFFKDNIDLPILGGITRDFFASQLNLYAILYAIFPTFVAYIIGHFLKIFIALVSVILLGKDIFKNNYRKYESLIVLSGFLYGILPLYPAFSFSFVSLPLLIYILRKISINHNSFFYIALFLYPLLSYFTFFGIFIIGYLVIYTIFRSIKDKKVSKYLIMSILVLFAGYAACEYRLFRLILLDHNDTIRDTMVMGSLNFTQILKDILDSFVNGVFHANDLHKYIVLPLSIIYLLILNIHYIRYKQYNRILSDYFNITFFIIVFNSIVYGIYKWEWFRLSVETLIPPLKGFQFTRTIFFNPFLWYLCLFIMVKRIYDKNHKILAPMILTFCILVVLGTQTLYNDFYNTIYTHAYMLIKGKDTDSLSYKEFYSETLFQKIKKSIEYTDELSVAYGMHPAILQYSGISTLDGCLSYYYQDYKNNFREIIAPALEKSEVARVYFDEWGARAYIYSGTDEAIWKPVKKMNVTDYELSMDIQAFHDMGGKYIFSRIKLSNTEKLGLRLIDTYTDDYSPYVIYLYE